MTMTKTMPGVLEFPSSYQVMDAEEMTYVEGGLSVNVKGTTYQNKNNCTTYGNAHAGFDGLTASRIAREVYAHAWAYKYASSTKSNVAILNSSTPSLASIAIDIFASFVMNHAGIADIGGDSSLRVSVYNYIWDHF